MKFISTLNFDWDSFETALAGGAGAAFALTSSYPLDM
jgi:hypothetical protein